VSDFPVRPSTAPDQLSLRLTVCHDLSSSPSFFPPKHEEFLGAGAGAGSRSSRSLGDATEQTARFGAVLVVVVVVEVVVNSVAAAAGLARPLLRGAAC
jgi:hypothetical protein